ncbi:MAG: Fic family protein [Burkholderiales bacterium]
MRFDPNIPWNELPLLPPEAEVETRRVLKACIEARAALAELKQAAALLPNPAMLVNTIPLLEARSSSEIENVVTTTDRLFRYADDERAADPATKEALRYRTALREGFESLRRRPLSTNTAVEVCRRLVGADIEIRRTPGTKLVGNTRGRVIYTPPDGESRIRDLLANWERYLHEDCDVDPLVRMTVMHYQFEAIHPFADGNGRTGRILNLLYLVERGLIDQPVLYLSRFIIAHKAEYYRGLIEVTTRQRWEEWALYVLNAVLDTARWTTSRIRAVRELLGTTGEFIRLRDPKLHRRELVEAIFVQPYCRISHLVDRGIAKRETASAYLKRLCALGVLVERQFGREKVFVFPQLMSTLAGETGDPVPPPPGPARVARGGRKVANPNDAARDDPGRPTDPAGSGGTR